LTALGVAVPLTGDDNYNSRIEVRYRAAGEEAWRNALPLFRVRPETVSGWKARPQFAGSIFDLVPATTYEIELRAIDLDSEVDSTWLLTAATRPVPGGPGSPNEKRVSDARELSAALAAARPGDVILLANGIYTGQFGIRASGEPGNPIVIRGESQDGAVLDGSGCTGCNVLEVYGSFVYLERLTIRNGLRALRFQGSGAEGNVVRRVTIRDTTLGIGSRENQKDFYICDNVFEGRLPWPSTYFDDNGTHANDDGIRVQGFGHVVCYNRISGYGDAIKTEQDGARAIDFYGNDVLYTYDNGLELDGGEGNLRAMRNRFTNNFVPLSVQPVYGGPAYLIRNVALNAVHEQMKFHALGGNPPRNPSGILAFHNTFVSPGLALNLQTTATSHHFVVVNNLFIGPEKPAAGLTVDWTGRIDNGVFDYNGYFPDGRFRFSRTFPNFAAVQESGVETHGALLNGRIFLNGLIAPADYKSLLAPDEAVIGADSPAVDRGVALPGINDRFTGAAPDLGAHEAGCPAPLYGPRPEGVDESNMPRCPD
ncbi:MAG: chondroitinase-B domain-containing protein, partial [Bryobacteraceae bacterium]